MPIVGITNGIHKKKESRKKYLLRTYPQRQALQVINPHAK